MKRLCDEIHAMGLKAGIYSTPWITSYAKFPGGSSDDPAGGLVEGTWQSTIIGGTASIPLPRTTPGSGPPGASTT